MSSTAMIVLIILVVLFFGGFIFRSIKVVLKLALIIAAVLIGIYFVKPELLHESFGKEKVDAFVNKAENVTKDVISKTKDLSNELTDTTIVEVVK